MSIEILLSLANILAFINKQGGFMYSHWLGDKKIDFDKLDKFLKENNIDYRDYK